jgi:hypothetical protein
MTVTRKKQPIPFIYHLDLFPINKVQEEKYLGVLMPIMGVPHPKNICESQ